MVAIDTPRQRWAAAAWLTRLLRKARLRPRKGLGTPDAFRLPDHMKRDIGLIDSTPPVKVR